VNTMIVFGNPKKGYRDEYWNNTVIVDKDIDIDKLEELIDKVYEFSFAVGIGFDCDIVDMIKNVVRLEHELEWQIYYVWKENRWEEVNPWK